MQRYYMCSNGNCTSTTYKVTGSPANPGPLVDKLARTCPACRSKCTLIDSRTHMAAKISLRQYGADRCPQGLA